MEQTVLRKNHINDQPKNLTRLNRGSPMKFMIPFLLAMLPVASVAQSQSGLAPGVPSVAIPKTTEVLVIQTPKQGVTPDLSTSGCLLYIVAS